VARELVVTAYDVSHPRRLARARGAVSAWAHGGQKSVWECFARPWERAALGREVLSPLSPEQDRLALLRPAEGGGRFLGVARPGEDAPLIYIGQEESA